MSLPRILPSGYLGHRPQLFSISSGLISTYLLVCSEALTLSYSFGMTSRRGRFHFLPYSELPRPTESRQTVLHLVIRDLRALFHESLRGVVAPASATGYAICVEDDGNISMKMPGSSHDMIATSLYALTLVSNVINASLVTIRFLMY